MTLFLGKVIRRTSNYIFQRKVDALRGRIWKVAVASGSAAAIPVPGLSFAVDAALIRRELFSYRSQLGLPEVGSVKFLKLHLITKETFLSNGRTTATQLRGVLAPYATEAAVEEVTRYIPVVGLVIASGMSFGATHYALSKLLTSVEEAAKLVLKEAAEKTAADLEQEID